MLQVLDKHAWRKKMPFSTEARKRTWPLFSLQPDARSDHYPFLSQMFTGCTGAQRLRRMRENALRITRNIASAMVCESARLGRAASELGDVSWSSSARCWTPFESLAFSGIGGAAAVAIYGPCLDDCVVFRPEGSNVLPPALPALLPVRPPSSGLVDCMTPMHGAASTSAAGTPPQPNPGRANAAGTRAECFFGAMLRWGTVPSSAPATNTLSPTAASSSSATQAAAAGAAPTSQAATQSATLAELAVTARRLKEQSALQQPAITHRQTHPQPQPEPAVVSRPAFSASGLRSWLGYLWTSHETLQSDISHHHQQQQHHQQHLQQHQQQQHQPPPPGHQPEEQSAACAVSAASAASPTPFPAPRVSSSSSSSTTSSTSTTSTTSSTSTGSTGSSSSTRSSSDHNMPDFRSDVEPWALGPELFASTPNRTAEPRPRSERQLRFDAAATETRAHLENTLGALHAQEHLHSREVGQRFLHASQLGSAQASYNLGVCYENGLGGVDRCIRQALQHYRRAAAAGHAGALFNLAVHAARGTPDEPADPTHARHLLESAASQQLPEALAHLGLALLNGSAEFGISRPEPERAVGLLLKCLAPRPAPVSFALGVCFERGVGIAVDLVAAETHYAQAAENGHAAAQYNYAVFLQQGRGSRQSRRDAGRWLQLSAAQGNEDALIALEDMDASFGSSSSSELALART